MFIYLLYSHIASFGKVDMLRAASGHLS